jgi:hypothetical protein
MGARSFHLGRAELSLEIPMFRKFILLFLALAFAAAVSAAQPTKKDGITRIHLDQYNGYFAAQETLVDLKPGRYEFVVSNKTDKLVGFLIEDGGSEHQRLDMFPIEPGKTRTTLIDIDADGFRYRCPINPTPWYDVSVGQ